MGTTAKHYFTRENHISLIRYLCKIISQFWLFWSEKKDKMDSFFWKMFSKKFQRHTILSIMRNIFTKTTKTIDTNLNELVLHVTYKITNI